MSDNKRVGGKANDGKNGARRRNHLRLKKKLRAKAKKEAGLKLSRKKTKVVKAPNEVLKKTVVKKTSTKIPVSKKSVAKKPAAKKIVDTKTSK